MPCFQPVRAGKFLQHQVAVVLVDVAPHKIALAEIVIVLGIILDEMAGEFGEVYRRHQLSRRFVEAVGIDEVRLCQPDLLRALVHQAHEILDRAPNPLGNNEAGIVARHDDDAADQVLDRDLVADVDEALGARALAPGALRNGELIRQLHPVILQPLEQEFQRH